MRTCYAIESTSLGEMLVVASEAGLRAVAFGDTADEAIASLRGRRELGSLEPHSPILQPYLTAIRAYLEGRPLPAELPQDTGGTPFQQEVWQALRDIPAGETRTYGAIAAALGRPSAARAVGAAIGANPIALIIPCHRAVPAAGGIGAFRWGTGRKRLLLDLERGLPLGSR
jgi:AraC family transcriptional regulator, regulatory protein of adaptative response / methylated-DNA-[protein]-cysteine methyltransferase